MSVEPLSEQRGAPGSARDRILAAAVRRIAREGIEDVRIARIAMDAGVSTALRRFPGLIHAFVNSIGVSRVSRDAMMEIAGATRAMLSVQGARVATGAVARTP